MKTTSRILIQELTRLRNIVLAHTKSVQDPDTKKYTYKTGNMTWNKSSTILWSNDDITYKVSLTYGAYTMIIDFTKLNAKLLLLREQYGRKWHQFRPLFHDMKSTDYKLLHSIYETRISCKTLHDLVNLIEWNQDVLWNVRHDPEFNSDRRIVLTYELFLNSDYGNSQEWNHIDQFRKWQIRFGRLSDSQAMLSILPESVVLLWPPSSIDLAVKTATGKELFFNVLHSALQHHAKRYMSVHGLTEPTFHGLLQFVATRERDLKQDQLEDFTYQGQIDVSLLKSG